MQYVNGSSISNDNPINLKCKDLICNNISNANITTGAITTDTISTAAITVNNAFIPGYIPSTLTFYEEFDITITSTGCIERSIKFSFMRIGKHVTLSFEGFNTSPQVCTDNGTLNFNSLIPSRFRPDIDENAVIRVNFNGTEQVGSCIIIGGTGNFQIFSGIAGGGWSTGNLINVAGFSVSYTVP